MVLETVNFTSYHLKRRTQHSLIIPVSSLYSWVFTWNVCSSFADVKSWNTNSISAKKINKLNTAKYTQSISIPLSGWSLRWTICTWSLWFSWIFYVKMKVKKDKSNRKIEKILTTTKYKNYNLWIWYQLLGPNNLTNLA